MMYNGRLKEGQKLQLHMGDQVREFTICQCPEEDEQERQGSFAFCYDAAYCDWSGTVRHGKLKQFCTADNHPECFKQEAEKYIEPYRELLRLVSEDREMSLLYTFIPAFEIYYGDDNRPYIWTNEVPMKTFEAICGELFMGTRRTEDRLYEIVRTLKALTDCIRVLHIKNLVHGDITPSNFGFYLRGDMVLADGVSLFDLNSLRYTHQKPTVYTPPYYDGRIRSDKDLGNRADVRAIVICLCKALFRSDDADKEIDRIKNETRPRQKRALIEEIMAAEGLGREDAGALEKSVCKQLAALVADAVTRNAGECTLSCTTLYQRLQTLETYLLPRCTRSDLGRGLGIEVVNREERRKNKVRQTFQYLLYDAPLYQWQRDGRPYQIVLFGFGLDAQNFLDVCLETGQSMDAPLEVSVWAGDRLQQGKRYYLSQRPALEQFFQVDGVENKEGKEPYGRIRFFERKGKNLKEQVKYAAETCREVQYIYIAVGSDGENAQIAEAFVQLLGADRASVNAQCEYGRDDGAGVHYVCIEDEIEKTDAHDEIERMAFNTHLVWSGTLNAELEKKRKNYDADYFHDSCVSHALSIKYKLHTLGIDLADGVYEAADRLREKLRENPAYKGKLVAAEHRRWVTEKLCFGWINMSVEDSLRYNDTKDILGKRHTCIVRSGIDLGLRQPEWQGYKTWDNASEEELGKLDELDRMSVLLHQAYRESVNAIDRADIFSGQIARSILLETEGLEEVQRAFLEWQDCLRDIQGKLFAADLDKRPNIQEYETLYARLTAAVNRNIAAAQNELRRQSIRNKIDAIYRSFLPVTKWLQYHDYKQNDVDLIEKIPFILTYTDDITLVVPLDERILACGWDDAKPTELFSYVAAATVINPRRVCMPYIAVEPEAAVIGRKKEAIRNYFKRKGLQAEIRFVPLTARAAVSEVLGPEFHAGPESWILWDRNGADILDAEQRPAGRASGYVFDMVSMTFGANSPSWLNDIDGDAYITVRDLVCFLGREPGMQLLPAFSRTDILALWDIYSVRRAEWKKTCRVLKLSSSRYTNIAWFPKSPAQRGLKQHKFILPYACFAGAGAALECLKGEGLIKAESTVVRHSVDACMAVINEDTGCDEALNTLFSDLYVLMLADTYRLTRAVRGKVEGCYILYDGLSVRDIPRNISKENSPKNDIVWERDLEPILSRLAEKGFIRLQTRDNSFDITYGSRQIKDLLMSEGRFLEVYTYYKAKELDRFDDAVTGIELKGQGKNEIDCFVTKGFRTILVECKARTLGYGEKAEKLLRGFVEDLHSNVQKYGINGIGLLVLDSDQEPPRLREKFPDVVICPPERVKEVGQFIAEQFKNGDD